jgi:hypothetical protein
VGPKLWQGLWRKGEREEVEEAELSPPFKKGADPIMSAYPNPCTACNRRTRSAPGEALADCLSRGPRLSAISRANPAARLAWARSRPPVMYCLKYVRSMPPPSGLKGGRRLGSGSPGRDDRLANVPQRSDARGEKWAPRRPARWSRYSRLSAETRQRIMALDLWEMVREVWGE